MFRKALQYYSVANLCYIVLSQFVRDTVDKYGEFSIQHWVISSVVWLFGSLMVWVCLKVDEWQSE